MEDNNNNKNKEELTFPRVMLVSDKGLIRTDVKFERIVLGFFNGMYVAVSSGFEGYYEEGLYYKTTTWKFAQELGDPVDMTMADIERELGKKINIIK